MEFKLRHAQPFTIEQATLLDIPVITAEIARLQNSLHHLQETQLQLQENVDSGEHPDPVILQALEENKVVISSQEERVSMLRMALELKGLVDHSNPHYDPPRPSDPRPVTNVEPPTNVFRGDVAPAAEADGVFL